MKEPRGLDPRHRVVVGLHGRRAPLGAVGLARLVARAEGVPLHGLFPWPSPLAPGEVQRLLRLAPDALEGLVIDVEVGDPAERLVAAAREPGTLFVIVGVDPDDPDDLGVGRIAHEVLRQAEASVVLVPPGREAPRLERILLPLDGSPRTAAPIAPVGELARRAQASLDIVFVGEAHAAAAHFAPGSMAAPLYVDQPQHEWPAFSNEFLHRFLSAIGHCPRNVATRLFLGAGEPGPEILRWAHELESDLVVLVWHGCCDGAHGAAFRTVVREARCPVLVVRGS
jgi:nucleotide-binding universal stress UspA family protein